MQVASAEKYTHSMNKTSSTTFLQDIPESC